MRTCTLIALAAVLCLCTSAAQAYAPVITVGESGIGSYNGRPLSYSVGPDPGPGGLAQTLIYWIPDGAIPGDLILTETGSTSEWSDVIRWNAGGMLVFYSDNIGGAEDLADTPSPPTDFYPNLLFLEEQGIEGGNGVFYVPQYGQPGYNPYVSGLAYRIISDVPEPGSLLALVTGLAGFGGLVLRKRR